MQETDVVRFSNGAEASVTESTMPWWLRLIVVLCALLMTLGAVIAFVRPAMLVSPNDQITEAVRIYAGYLAARNLAVALMLLAMLAIGARKTLGGLMFLTGLIQFLDTCMDCVEGRWAVAPGVFVLGLICVGAAAKLSGSPFWRMRAWKSG